jgi:hypothetical protein
MAWKIAQSPVVAPARRIRRLSAALLIKLPMRHQVARNQRGRLRRRPGTRRVLAGVSRWIGPLHIRQAQAAIGPLAALRRAAGALDGKHRQGNCRWDEQHAHLCLIIQDHTS